FAAHRPDVVLQTQVQAPEVELTGVPAAYGRGRAGQPQTETGQWARVRHVYALAGLDQGRGEVVLKAVNPTPSPVSATVMLRGMAKVGAKARVATLAHAEATAENTLDRPDKIVPRESDLAVAGPRFPLPLPANSVTILRVEARTEGGP
ncbi:MAG: hypothetical protein KBE04_15750, partial [Phycisphaerae bacterium]|nr:hypothetical protein [Phycisphaerae bacterium]